MLIFSLPFLAVILVILMRYILMTSPSVWESTNSNVRNIEFKTRTYRGNHKAIFPKVSYEYSVQSKTYVSKRISLDLFDITYNDNTIQNDEFIEKLKSTNIVVEYFKFIPSISVINRSFYNGKDYIVTIAGILWVLFLSLLALHFMLRP